MDERLNKYVEQAKKDYRQKELDRLGLTPEEEQEEQIVKFFCALYDMMERNPILPEDDKDKFFVRHFCDSIQPLLLFGFGRDSSLLDIGGTAGFPGIPTAIFRPDMTITLVEGDAAKRDFLVDAVAACELKNVTILSSVEEVKGQKFDYVVQRSNETLQDFTRIGRDFVDENGRLYTFGTENFHMELGDITAAKDEEGVCVSEIIEYDLANEIFGRNLVAFDLFC